MFLGVVGLLAAVVIGFVAGRGVERQAESAPTSIPPGRLSPDLLLSWEPVTGLLESGVPLSVVRFGDGYFAFYSDDQLLQPGHGVGLRAYRSNDGRHWTDLGIVIPEADVQEVMAADERLMAIGVWYPDQSPFGEPLSVPAVWTSDDSLSWQRSELPLQVEPGVPHWASVQAGAVINGRAVVFGLVDVDVDAMVRAALPQEMQEMAAEFGLAWDISAPSASVLGPFGFPVFTASFDELGLDTNLASFAEPWQTPQALWVSEDLRSWDISQQDSPGAAFPFGRIGPYPSEVLVGPEGEFIAVSSGSQLWSSPDGHNWNPTPVPGSLSGVTVFQDLLVGSRNGLGLGPGRLHVRYDQPVLMASTSDGQDWRMISPDLLLPSDDLQWDLGSLSAGSYGIAAVATGYTRPTPRVPQFFEPPPPAVISRGDLTVSHYQSPETVVLARNGETLLYINIWPPQPLDHVRFDIDARTMTILDPESGEVLITLTFEEIAAAHQDLYQEPESVVSEPTQMESLIVYTRDGQQWTTQSVANVTGLHTATFSNVFVLDDFVLALAQVIDSQPEDPTGRTTTSSHSLIGRLP